MKTLVSIIVPCYNAENTISKCLKSISKQTYKNIEIIVVDDGSKDQSLNVIKQESLRDNRIKLIHKRNTGVSDSRNIGIQNSKGEYICFVDADDWLSCDYIETLLHTAEKNKADIATCAHYLVTNKGNETIYTSSQIEYTSDEAIIEMLSKGNIGTAVWDKLFKAEIIKNNLFPYGEIVNEELFVLINSFSEANRIVSCGKPLYYYFFNNSSVSKTYSIDKAKIVNNNLKAICIWAKKRNRSIQVAARKFKAYYENAILLNLIKYHLIDSDTHFYKELKADFKKDIFYILINNNVSLNMKVKALLNWGNIYCLLYRLVRK